MAGPWYTKGAGGAAGSGTYRGLYVAATTWAVGDIVVPTVAYATAAAKKYVYKCTTAGLGVTEPTWVYTTPDTSTTTDGTAVFTCMLCDDWTHASPRPDYLINNLVAAGETLYSENVSYTFANGDLFTFLGTVSNPCYWISTSDTTNTPPTTIASGALMNFTYSGIIVVRVSGKAKINGVNFTASSTNNSTCYLNFGEVDGTVLELENSTSSIVTTDATSSIGFGYRGGNLFLSKIRTLNCTFSLGNSAGQSIYPNAKWEDIGSTFSITVQPTALFQKVHNATLIGSNLSAITSTLISATQSFSSTINFIQCKLGASVAIMAAQSGPYYCDAFVYDCSSGDNHYEFGHYNYLGNTTISTAIYLNGTDGASYNAADAKHSWKVTSVNGAFATPYVSPWISKYNEATSAVTPRLEVVRDGSTTAYNNDQVWGEFAYKGTTGFTIATVVNDARGLVAAAVAQSSSALGAGDWTGEGASAWFGKLEPSAAITPAEIGDMSARVCVAGAITVYINPKLLGT